MKKKALATIVMCAALLFTCTACSNQKETYTMKTVEYCSYNKHLYETSCGVKKDISDLIKCKDEVVTMTSYELIVQDIYGRVDNIHDHVIVTYKVKS